MPITANQAIRNAVEAERAASRFYRFLSENTHDVESKAFLVQMAEAEDDHAEAIEREGAKVAQGPLAARADSPVEMIETLPDWKYVEDLGLAAAIEVAHEAELQAALYYDAFADHFEGVTRKFFEDLARVEEEHARKLEERRKALR